MATIAVDKLWLALWPPRPLLLPPRCVKVTVTTCRWTVTTVVLGTKAYGLVSHRGQLSIFGRKVTWVSPHFGSWTSTCRMDICWGGHADVLTWTHVNGGPKLWHSDGGTSHQKSLHLGLRLSNPSSATFLDPGKLTLPLVFLWGRGIFIRKTSSAQETRGKKATASRHPGWGRLKPAAPRHTLAGLLKPSPNVKRRNELQLINRCFSLWRDILGRGKGHQLALSFPSHCFVLFDRLYCLQRF